MNKNKYVVYGVIIALLVIVLVGLLVYKNNGKLSSVNTASSTPQDKTVPLPKEVGVQNFNSTQLPPNFPKNMPMEAKAEILQNQSVKDPVSGKIQAYVLFATKSTIDQNSAIYTQYIKDNGWTITGVIDQDKYRIINAKKDNLMLSILLDYKTDSTKNQVGISYIY